MTKNLSISAIDGLSLFWFSQKIAHVHISGRQNKNKLKEKHAESSEKLANRFPASIYTSFISVGFEKYIPDSFFFYQGFLSRTLTTHRTAGEGRGPSYSTLALPPAHEHSYIYLQVCTWDDYLIFLIATLVFTRLLLDEIYHLIGLLFDWLMM